MSNAIELFLKRNPIITRYAQIGLINISSLSKYIKENNIDIDPEVSIAAIGMFIRRYLSHLPKTKQNKTFITDHPVNLVIRTGMRELIFNKTLENRRQCLILFEKISRTKHFSCVVEGEQEIVLLTDHPLSNLLKNNSLRKQVAHQTKELGYISIDFPIKLREVLGVYNYVTQVLFLANISIHSFHTIGGEILILVKNQDLVKAQEVLTSALQIT